MKKYPDTTLVGVFPVKGTLLFDGSPMVYVFPQYMAVYRTECDTEEKFDRVYLFDEHVNSSTVEFDEELFSLSTLLQWIWRSQIRDGKPIEIYIPSERMRSLLKIWIEECKEEVKKIA